MTGLRLTRRGFAVAVAFLVLVAFIIGLTHPVDPGRLVLPAFVAVLAAVLVGCLVTAEEPPDDPLLRWEQQR